MPRTLFIEQGTDKVYEAIREEINDRCREARDFVEELWPRVGHFLDPGFSSKLGQQFHQHFWELYLAATLHDSDLRLEKQGSAKGPDILLQAANQRTWVEAIAVEPGNGADAVTEATPGDVRDVPDDQIKLRLTNALDEKFRKYQDYIRKSIVSDSDRFIIAVNAARVPSARKERELPRIVRTLFPIGHEILHIENETGRLVRSTYEYQGKVLKQSGTGISTTAFQDPRYEGISAIIYSCSDVFNRPDILGSDCVTVHNPLARNPLSRNFFQRGSVFWVDSCLRNHRWSRIRGQDACFEI